MLWLLNKGIPDSSRFSFVCKTNWIPPSHLARVLIPFFLWLVIKYNVWGDRNCNPTHLENSRWEKKIPENIPEQFGDWKTHHVTVKLGESPQNKPAPFVTDSNSKKDLAILRSLSLPPPPLAWVINRTKTIVGPHFAY